MLEDTHEILQELCGDEWSNTHVAYVSRTTHANWAKTCLQLLQVTPNVSMDQLGALQVLPASWRVFIAFSSTSLAGLS